MKKSFAIIALALFTAGVTSCKKNEKVETSQETTTETTAENTAEIPTETPAATPEGVVPPAEVAQAQTPDKQNEESLKKATAIPQTTIALSESNFDFGNIKKGDKVEHVYEITNTGKNPLVISEVKPGCGCTAPDFTKDPILPGKKGKITLHFDSSSFDNQVQKFADVFANVEKAPIKLTFTANVQPK